MPSENTVHPQRAVVCRIDGSECDELDLKLSRSWLRIAVAGVFAGQGMILSLALNMTPPDYGSTAYWVLHGLLIFSSLVVMGFLGGPLFASTWGMMRSKRLSIEGLFTLSLLGAFLGSVAGSLTGEGAVFYEIVSIVIAIYTFGRMLGERSQAKLQAESRQLRARFDRAVRVDPDGKMAEVGVEQVAPGEVVRVDPGCAFTVDGCVRSGEGFVSETSLTGEPLPVARHPGDRVRAGTFSVDGSFEVEVLAGWGRRELDGILDTVESLSGRPSELQLQANQLVQYFLPVVAGTAVLTALVWALIGSWMDAVFNSMAVLLVACPCALGLATPVAIWNGLYRLARMGLVSRDGAFIDGLARAKGVYFDKTGTLSEMELQVTEVLVAPEWEADRKSLFSAVQAIESHMTHPVACTLSRHLSGVPESEACFAVADFRILPALGVEARVSLGGRDVLIRIGEPVTGKEKLGHTELERALLSTSGKRVRVSVDQQAAAVFVLQERARSGLADMWSELQELGLRLVVLTGDPNPELPLPAQVVVHAGLSAEAKAAVIRDALAGGEWPCLIGDGINDAAAMSAAASSIAMGSGTGLTQSAAMAQLLDDRLGALPEAIRTSRKIRSRLRGNLVYAAAYNVLGMALACLGLLHPVAAALIMLVSSGFVTLRAVVSSSEVKV